jgi:hypothetical protein
MVHWITNHNQQTQEDPKMKPITTKLITATVASVAVVALITGCATTGYERAERTGEKIAAFRKDVLNISKSVDSTMAGLNKIIETANNGPVQAYNQFSKSLAELDKAVETAKARAKEIQVSGDDYFKQWEKQLQTVQNPDIRAAADAQKAKLQETFARIKPLAQQAKADFEPFSNDCHDLQKVLNNDLTVTGVDAAKSLIDKTVTHGQAVQKSLDKLMSEMNSISAAITPAKVQAKK